MNAGSPSVGSATGSREVHHVVLTRYNLPSPGRERRLREQETWLRDRTALFERFTVPSMRRLVSPTVHWLVYVDPASPAWFSDHMDGLEEQGLLRVLRREEVPRDALVADLRAAVGRDHGPVVTTNLDNDDALAADFSRRVTAVAPPPGASRVAVYVTSGLVLAEPRLFRRHDRDNAFCSVREDLAEPVSCWVDWHTRLSAHMPVARVGGGPGWLQVVHGANVSNGVRGRLVSPDAYRAAFGTALDRAVAPSTAERLTDTALHWPARMAVERGRRTAGRVLLAAAGKGGLERVKARVLDR